MVDENVSKISDSLTDLDKLLLFAVGLDGKNLRTKVKLQKFIFLFTRALPYLFEDPIIFVPHKKGPYSEEIEDVILTLIDNGLLVKDKYVLSELGIDVYNSLSLPSEIEDLMIDIKDLLCILNENELLTLIYASFPDFTKNSEYWDSLKPYLIDNVSNMYLKGAITYTKALEISNLSPDDFNDIVRNKMSVY